MGMATAMAMVMVRMGPERVRRVSYRERSELPGSVSLKALADARGPGDARLKSSLVGISLLSVFFPVHAENWQITPSISVSETLTNNLFLSSSNRTGDLVTGITPGISINGQGARARLNLNYGLTQQLYARESSQNNRQNALTASGTLEAIEDFLFIDASGVISQQYLSAFGPTSPSIANIDNNRTETSSYSISPYVKGRFLSSTEYFLRYSTSTTSSQSSLASDMTMSQWVGRINGTTRWSSLGWSLDASRVSTNYDLGRDRTDTRYGLTLPYRFTPQFQLSAILGRETTNMVSLQDKTYNDSGFGLVWSPSPRTKLEGTMTRRYFGNGYQVAFSHRMRRSLIRYSASRDVSYQPAGVNYTGQGSNYDAYYAIVAANNPGASPQDIRAQVSQILQGRGVPADGTVVNGFLNNRPTLSTGQQLSLALLGVRNTVTFNASEVKQQPLGLVSGVTDDFSLANQITQRGAGVVWGHQLTGFTSLSLSLNQSRSLSQLASQVDNKTTGAYFLLTTQVSPNATANIGARRVIYDGAVNTSYTESALTGVLSYRF